MGDSYLITPQMFTTKMNILIYGDAGAGKTHLAGTAQDVPTMADVHVFNIDGGIMTLAQRGDIHATDIHSVDDLEQELYKIINGDEKYKTTKTVVIDNITELQTLALESQTMQNFADRKKKNKNYSVDEVYLEDYGVAGKRLARILRGFRDLPIHVIYIAHRKDKMRQGTNVLEESKPNLTDKLSTAIMGYMDYVWYLYTADETVGDEDRGYTTEMHRYMLTQPMNNFAAKTRGSEFATNIGAVIKDPTFPMIWDIYSNTYTG
jgi:phage nucleotide-binding protein